MRQRSTVDGRVLVQGNLLRVVKLGPELYPAASHRNLRGYREIADGSAVIVYLGRACRRTSAAFCCASGVVKTAVAFTRRALIALDAAVAEIRGNSLLCILIYNDLRDVRRRFTGR